MITQNGLIFSFDSMNKKSYGGEQTTNLISQVNSYPSIGNSWGTYNVNQYNSAQYFSIGTISSVVDNIVTTSSNHPLRTYDAVRPQTTGGGLTAGVDYYIKKISNTQFSVHQYISTQNGSVGFTCLSNIQSNTKISINSTNFPTMWWGAPHLPNSGIIKTIVQNGFNYEGRKHDFLRHHAYRPDAVVDGMAYGVHPTIGGNVTFTMSCMMRAVTTNSVSIVWQSYVAGTTPQSNTLFSGILTKDWKRYTYTKTTITGATYLILYWLYQTGNSIIDISEIQVEIKDHPTLYTTGTRDGNGYDLLSNKTLTISGTTQNITDKSIVFDGVDDHILVPNFYCTVSSTVEMWLKSSSYDNKIPFSIDSDTYSSGPNIFFYTNKIHWNIGDAGSNPFSNSSYPDTNWKHIVVVNDMSTNVSTLYINSIEIGTALARTTLTTDKSLYIGKYHGDNNYSFNGNISMVKVYNRCLSITEIQQNYRTLKGRYGL